MALNSKRYRKMDSSSYNSFRKGQRYREDKIKIN